MERMERATYRRKRVARRRVVAAAIAVVVAAGAWLVVARHATLFGGSPASGSALAAGSGRTSSTTPGGPIRPVGTFQVATAQLTLVDNPGPTQRSLPTTIWYPKARGTRPLLLFSQGFWRPVSLYQVLLSDWASAGFVVAAPTYPHTNPPPHPGTPATPTGTDISDTHHIVNHPAELRFVLASVLSTAAEPGNLISGRVDPHEVGLVGHSDGADISLAVATNSADFTAKVKAVAVLSGAELPTYFGGTYFTPALPRLPLLAVQSRTDAINYPSCSVQLYNGALAAKWYLQLSGVRHTQGYVTPPTRTVVAQVVARFFAAELAHQPGAMDDIAAVADTAASSISSGPTAPPQPGNPTCDATP